MYSVFGVYGIVSPPPRRIRTSNLHTLITHSGVEARIESFSWKIISCGQAKRKHTLPNRYHFARLVAILNGLLFMLVLRIVSQNVTKPLDSLRSGRNPLASVNHNVPRCPPDAGENLSSAEKKARVAELTRVRMARYRQNKKEKEKKKESVIINSNVTRAASIEETIQPFAAVVENTAQSVPQEDVREAPNDMTAVDTSVSHSRNRCFLFRM